MLKSILARKHPHLSGGGSGSLPPYRFGLTLMAGLAISRMAAAAEVKPFTEVKPPPGAYVTSWLGNSFSGSGGQNGFGYWVQNGADEIEVTPDGTVIAGMGWDEAGRCVGLYKDGQVNRILLKVPGNGAESAWGWGTGNNALSVSGDQIYIANTGKRLLRFKWKPGDINSAVFVEQMEMPEEAVGLNARGETLAVAYPNRVEIRNTKDLKPLRQFEVKDAKDLLVAPDGNLWILAGDTIRLYSSEGKPLGKEIPGLQKPSSLAFDNKGRLIITDNGARQQALFFDVSNEPNLVETFGEKGGLLAGTPGKVAPEKLFGLRGAGTDSKGNLYVGLSYGNGPAGNLFIRSFAPSGQMDWELMSTAFVDTFGFDPQSDGEVVYSRTALFDLDLDKTKPGSEWSLRAMTLDPLTDPKDERLSQGSSTLVRRLDGKPVLFVIGQYAGGYRIYTFEPGSFIAKEADRISGNDQWAWDVADNGDIWNGDTPEKTIRRYPFKGLSETGKPTYDWKNPQTFPWPDGWKIIRRINYDQPTDTLYLTGYLEEDRVDSWGVSGATVRRYDHWLKGDKKLRWTVATPHDGNTHPDEGPLSPSSFDVTGEYLFFGMVKPTNNRQYVHIFRNDTGKYVGTFEPGSAIVTPGTEPGVGWLDMPYSIQAMKRKNGEYLILVEEDWRGKNMLYRWKPNAGVAKR